MNDVQDAKKAIRALGQYADEAFDAYLNKCFTQLDSPAYASLKKNRLTTQLDEQSPPRLRNVVNRLLSHCLGRSRHQSADAAIAGLWQDLIVLFEQYHDANRVAAYQDAFNIEMLIQESLSELIEEINAASVGFVRFINEEFSQVSHIDLRIKLNEQAIARAKRLTAVLEGFALEERNTHVRNNEFLTEMLLRHLPRELELAAKNLSYAMGVLIERLVKLRKEQRTQKLIFLFHQKFQQDPHYKPSIEVALLSKAPPFLSRGEGHIRPASVDVNAQELTQVVALVDIVKRLSASRNVQPPAPREKLMIEQTAAQVQEVITSEIDDFIAEIVFEIRRRKGAWLASSFLPYAPTPIGQDDFFLLLMGRIKNLPLALRHYHLEFMGESLGHSPHTRLVEDLRITWTGAHAE